MPQIPYPDYYPRRINMRVPNLKYASDVTAQGLCRVDFGAPLALSTTYFASAVLSTTGVALTLTASAGTILNQGIVPDNTTSRWGRGLTFVGDGASTRTITVTGYDYLGQRMQWTGALNGTTPVACAKAFKYIESVVFGSAADTVSVSIGYNNVLGLPYKAMGMTLETKNEAVAANAGTFVAGLASGTAPSATNADVRGTYLPVTVIPDGTNTFMIDITADLTNLHGQAQYTT